MEISFTTGLMAALILLWVKLVLTLGYSGIVNSRKSLLRERVENGQKYVSHALKVGEDATRLMATYQFLSIILDSIIVLLVMVTFADSIEKASQDALSTGLLYGLLICLTSVFLLVLGDRIPTVVGASRPERYAIFAGWVMFNLVRFFAPLILLILRISGQIATLFGGDGSSQLVTEEEIKTLVDAGQEEGVLEDEEKEMIYSIIRFFDDTLAREVMVPRIDIVALDIDSTIEQALDLIITEGHSRIPVYRDTIDNIVGSLYAKDLLKVWRDGQKLESLQSLLREAYFIPESKKASDLLIELQERKTHLVYVVDEFGGTAGILTIEDLVEEIVGEIQDEYDFKEEAPYEEISETEYVFNARIDLDNVNHLLGVSLPTEESDTLGGYIFEKLGRVPVPGDEIAANQVVIRVLSVTGRRIRRVNVQKVLPQQPEESDDHAKESRTTSTNPTVEAVPTTPLAKKTSES
ncbi:MAG: HlyC/CorC family transporter [Chloroflexi bacterium]|nr:HlyC/CorC family transporter [Chloroflexota bacterium]